MKQQQKYVYETKQDVTLRLSHVSRIIRYSFNCFENFELQLSILVVRSMLHNQKCFPKIISTGFVDLFIHFIGQSECTILFTHYPQNSISAAYLKLHST